MHGDEQPLIQLSNRLAGRDGEGVSVLQHALNLGRMQSHVCNTSKTTWRVV